MDSILKKVDSKKCQCSANLRPLCSDATYDNKSDYGVSAFFDVTIQCLRHRRCSIVASRWSVNRII